MSSLVTSGGVGGARQGSAHLLSSAAAAPSPSSLTPDTTPDSAPATSPDSPLEPTAAFATAAVATARPSPPLTPSPPTSSPSPPSSSCPCELHRHLVAAAAWLDRHPHLEPATVLDTFLGLPHVQELSTAQHSRIMENGEKLLRLAFAVVGRRRVDETTDDRRHDGRQNKDTTAHKRKEEDEVQQEGPGGDDQSAEKGGEDLETHHEKEESLCEEEQQQTAEGRGNEQQSDGTTGVDKRAKSKTVGGDGGLMPLPLPADRPACGCAELGRLSVTRIWLSGSTREAADVRLVSCGEKADLDVMLALGPAHVRAVAKEDGRTVAWEDKAVAREDRTGMEVDRAAIGEEGTVIGEEETTTVGERAAIGEERAVIGEERAVMGKDRTVIGEKSVAERKGAVTGEGSVTGDERAVTGDERAVMGEEGTVTRQKRTVMGEEETVIGDEKIVREEDGTVPEQAPLQAAPKDQRQPKTSAAASGRPDKPESSDEPGLAAEEPGTLRLTAEPSCHPGFLLLRHPLRTDCRHAEPLVLPSSRIRHLMDAFGAGVSRGRRDQAGPAVTGHVKNLSQRASPLAIDVVGCLPLDGGWNSRGFADRPRPSGRPDADTVRRLCRTPVMIVPVGFPGGGLEEEEWRLSFSRHEYIAYRSMSWEQRRCLLVLKYCRTALGGSTGAVKSYYLKTALLWRWESASADSWSLSSLYETLIDLLTFLESSITQGHLPCYFLRDINLLASRTPAELVRLSEGLAAMRRHLLSSLLALASLWANCDPSLLGERCLAGDGPAEMHRVADLQAASAPFHPLVSESFDSLLRGLLGAAAGAAPVWSLLTLLFQVVRLSWLGPTLADEADWQRRPEAQRRRRPSRSPSGSPSSPEAGYGWLESMLLIAQHTSEAARQPGVDSWLEQDVAD